MLLFWTKSFFSSSANRNVLFFSRVVYVWNGLFCCLKHGKCILGWLHLFCHSPLLPETMQFLVKFSDIEKNKFHGHDSSSPHSPHPPKNGIPSVFSRRKPRKRISRLEKKGGTVQKCVNVDWYCVGGRERPCAKADVCSMLWNSLIFWNGAGWKREKNIFSAPPYVLFRETEVCVCSWAGTRRNFFW